MQKYWTPLKFDHRTKSGKNIYTFKCLICNGEYKNSTNAAAHCAACLERLNNSRKQKYMTILEAFGLEEGTEVPKVAVDPIQILPKLSRNTISLEHKALIELIAEMGIPYTQIESPAWESFIHTLNPGFVIPMKDCLRNLIIEHAENLIHEGLQDLQSHICGLAIDGATLISLHIYGFVLISNNGLRLVGFKYVDDQKGQTLALAISEMIKECSKHGISISSIVSDNAASLKSAITNADEDNSFTLKALIGEEVLRCACAAHTCQLSIKDLIQELPFMQEFMNQVILLLNFISDKSSGFKKYCTVKIPKFIATRWNTLFSCANFIIENVTQINEWLSSYIQEENERFKTESILFSTNKGKNKKAPKPLTLPPVEKVPEEWSTYLEPLAVIATFTDKIEGDLNLQQDVYLAVIEAKRKLDELASKNNFVAEELLNKFQERFETTADLTLAHLAFIFTPDGLESFRILPDSPEKRETRSQLKKKFLELSLILTQKYRTDTHFLPAIFDFYIDFVEFGTGENPFAYWQSMLYKNVLISHVNNGKQIPLKTFVSIVLCLITLPASEAMIERAFSQIKAILTDYNKSMNGDLFIALSSIKVSNRYKRKYPMNFKILD